MCSPVQVRTLMERACMQALSFVCLTGLVIVILSSVQAPCNVETHTFANITIGFSSRCAARRSTGAMMTLARTTAMPQLIRKCAHAQGSMTSKPALRVSFRISVLSSQVGTFSVLSFAQAGQIVYGRLSSMSSVSARLLLS